MRRLFTVLAVTFGLMLPATAAFAGSPHFVSVTVTRTGDTLTVAGKEAGLGDEDQVHIVASATAQCVNGGGQNPGAANKTDVTSEGDFPVQNGKADFSLDLVADFQPDCSPPMTVTFSDVQVYDATNWVNYPVLGTF
jgi:hypothetical protein